MESNRIIHGDALEVLRTFESESVDSIIASPPYWQLRSYGTEGELGKESKFPEYVDRLAIIFDEAKRVLKKEGTCFINLGDTYSGVKKGKTDNKVSSCLKNETKGLKKQRQRTPDKSLCLIPYRFAIAMTERGWVCRNTIIWYKRNAMPSSASDRFTVDYEPTFFFAKSRKYYFEQQCEPYASASDTRYRQALRAGRSYNSKEPYKNNTPYSGKYKRGQGAVASRGNDADGLVVGGTNENGRNMRCVWDIPTKPSTESHFAMFPESLVERMILAGCPKGGIVLDPFVGSGTTCVVEKKLGRNYIGIDLNKSYCEMAEKRIAGTTFPLL